MKKLSQLFVLITIPMTVSFVVVVLLVGSFGTNAGPPQENTPGNVNCNSVYGIDDAIYILNNLFGDGPLPAIALCQEEFLTDDEVVLLREILPHLSVEFLDDGQGGTTKTIRFTGVNVQIVDGTDETEGVTNGLGNLIVGYNELGNNPNGDDRTGSHNIVGGSGSSYSSFGGLVVSQNNTISGEYL